MHLYVYVYMYVYFELTTAMGRSFLNLTAVIDRNSILISSYKAFMTSFCSFILVSTSFCSSFLSLEAKFFRKCGQALYSK